MDILEVLNKRDKELSVKERELSRKIQDIEAELQLVTERRREINLKRKRLLCKTIEVSDHAILRYQERVALKTPDEIRSIILTEQFLSLVEKLGPTGTYPIHDNVSARVHNRKVVTILV